MPDLDLEWWRFASESLSLAGREKVPPEKSLQILQEGLNVDAALLVVNPASSTEKEQTVVSVGYSHSVVDVMREWYPHHCPGYRYAEERRVAVRICDTPFDFRNTRTYADALGPSGFREGITVTFGTPGASPSGFLAMSSESPKPMGKEGRLGLTLLASELSRLVRPIASSPSPRTESQASLEIDATGKISWLRQPATDVVPEAQLKSLAKRVITSGIPHGGFYLQDNRRGWWHIRAEQAYTSRPAIVRISIIAQRPNGGLTARELDVLGLIYRGLTNGQIASELHISLRTVKSHVEALLQKLDQQNRAGLAATAAAYNLFNSYTLFGSTSYPRS